MCSSPTDRCPAGCANLAGAGENGLSEALDVAFNIPNMGVFRAGGYSWRMKDELSLKLVL